MAPTPLKEGQTLTAKFTVLESDLASATSPDPNDNYAKVLATPRLVSFMEVVCARLMLQCLSDSQLSVGVRVTMDHLAATPVDEQIEVTAKFLRMEKKTYVFETVIKDRGGEVGRGECIRAIIDEKRLLEGAKKRIEKASKL